MKQLVIHSIRRIRRNGVAALISIAGLSLGMACSIAIVVLLQFELGFDTHHPKRDRLFRVVSDVIRIDRRSASGGSPGALAEAMKNDIAGVEQATTVFVDQAGLFTVRRDGGVQKFDVEQGVARVTPEFFEMFGIEMVRGEASSLSAPYTMIIAESIAVRFFGSDDPIGHVVKVNNSREYRITGVMTNPPRQTHVGWTIVLSGATLREDEPWMYQWGILSTNVQTFVLLHEGISSTDVEVQTRAFTDRYMSDAIDKKEFRLQDIASVHFEPEYAGGLGRTTSRATLSALGIIGLFLIVTSSVNFVNMATAQASVRAREVGVRKVLGASTSSILGLIGREFLGLIAAAFVIAAPVAYAVMSQWLENFAFRIAMGPGVFVAAIAISVLLASVTVGVRALRAAGAKPSANLRYE